MKPDVVASKLAQLAEQVKATKGPFDLFGLFLREESIGLWDVVVAAPWLKAGDGPSFDYLADQLRNVLTNDELLGLSRIVILDSHGELTRLFLDRFKDKTGLVEEQFVANPQTVIKRAYIIVAQPTAQKTQSRTAKSTRRTKESSPK